MPRLAGMIAEAPESPGGPGNERFQTRPDASDDGAILYGDACALSAAPIPSGFAWGAWQLCPAAESFFTFPDKKMSLIHDGGPPGSET